MVLLRRRTSSEESPPQETAIEESSQDTAEPTPKETATAYSESVKSEPPKPKYKPDLTISTGSTLLDQAIFGGRRRGGGLPGGVIVEIFGESGLGKTALLAEICGCAQSAGGEVRFRDPEGRLDREYAEIYGVSLEGDNYSRPHYVHEVFDDIRAWNPSNKETVNIYGTDSLAALTTDLEMSDKGDKMGMRRAKEFSEGLRKVGVILAEGGYKTLVCTNQIRTGESGDFTPGGKGIPFWSSIRIRILTARQINKNKENFITKTVKVGAKNKEVTKTIGINCVARVVKNSKDDPHRDAPFSIVFGYGLDDVRANLQWLKDMTGDSVYQCGDGKSYQSIEFAIHYVESHNLEDMIKNNVIDLWEEIEDAFKDKGRRKRKIR